MRIVYCGCFRLPNFDAAAPRVLNNACAMKQCGHHVSFISWGGEYREDDINDNGKYMINGMEYTITGELDFIGLAGKVRGRFTKGRKTLKLLKQMQEKPDLIIMYNADRWFTRMIIRFCRTNNIKLANDITEWYDSNELHFPDILPNYINMTYTQHKVQNKIVISSFLDKYYSESNNILIPPLCDPNEPKWATDVVDERVKPFDGVTLIYAGNPVKKDCIHSVVNAVNTLANEGESIRFLILGSTRESYMKTNLHTLVNTTLHENVLFLGRVSQNLIPAYYKKADFMVLFREPNRKSMAGFATKFAESMTAGVPVITNATSDLSKYVINGKTGFLIEGYDYEKILSILKKKVLKLHKLDIKVMKENVKSSNKDFDWHNYIDKFREFIEKLR